MLIKRSWRLKDVPDAYKTFLTLIKKSLNLNKRSWGYQNIPKGK